MKTRNDIIMAKMVQYCEQIEGTVDRFGKDEKLYQTDYVFSNACNMCILQIGELVVNLDEDFKNEYSEIPWRQIRGMRNIFAHNYHNLDYEAAWNTIIHDIPALKIACNEILKKRTEK